MPRTIPRTIPSSMRPRSKWFTRAAGLAFGLLVLGVGCDRGDHPQRLNQPAPLFALNDGQHSVDLGQMRGQVVLLNFWATWCAPCIEEMPSLEALHREMPEVEIVGVATDGDPAAYSRFLQRRPLPYLTVLDSAGSSNAKYGTFRFPETYLIDKRGVIRRKFIGPQDWTSPDIVDTLRKLAG